MQENETQKGKGMTIRWQSVRRKRPLDRQLAARVASELSFLPWLPLLLQQMLYGGEGKLRLHCRPHLQGLLVYRKLGVMQPHRRWDVALLLRSAPSNSHTKQRL